MVRNNPLNLSDTLGLWATDQHHALIDVWLRNNPAPDGKRWSHFKWHCLFIDVPALLKAGNDAVDGVRGGLSGFCDAQSSANAYQHAMRAPWESVATAQSEYQNFINNAESRASNAAQTARRFAADDNMLSALSYLEGAVTDIGRAQHPIADSTSPPHSGFQVWFGIPDGIATLGISGYVTFVGMHHERETPSVYAGLGDGPATTVAGQIHAILLDVVHE
jgi:hypothetical protein